jgi:hypothetical protein
MAMKWASFAQFLEDFGSSNYRKNCATMDLYCGTSEGASEYEGFFLLHRGTLEQ